MKRISIFLVSVGSLFIINGTDVFARDFDLMDWMSGHSCQVDSSKKTYSCPINRIAPRRGDQLTGIVIDLKESKGWAHVQVCATRHDNPRQKLCARKQSSDSKIIFQKKDLNRVRSVPPGWGTYLDIEVDASSLDCQTDDCILGYGVQWDTKMSGS